MRKVVVIGAGPAGLAAGFKLCESKINPIILEKDSIVGGISRTIKYKGCYFDIGGHRFFTKNKLVFNWWREILKDDFVKRPRYSRIYYRGKFFNYPISITNVIFNLGIFHSVPVLFSYLKSRLFPSRDEKSFEKWVTNRFGNRLYQIFFKSYTEKIWGIPGNQISADWAMQRIKGLSLVSVLRNALFKGKKNTIKTLIKEFYYPRLGSGMMYEAVGERIIQRGGLIKLNSEVIQIKHDNNRITALICRNTKDETLFEIEGTDFCSSMPLNLLVSRMDPSPGRYILEMCKRLNYRSLLMVYFVLGRKDLFKDNWIYIHSPDVAVCRIQNYKNWSPDMVSDPNESSLGLEYFCTEGDSMWCQSDKVAIELAANELEKLKIASKNDIRDAFVLRVSNAYPVYDKNYHEALQVIKDFIGRFSNLQCIGRTGMFCYNGMDHSVLTGFLAAENIFGAKNNLWGVNADQSYLEEFKDSGNDNSDL
jgi:protoporphyrinogen oxidase